MSLSFEVMETEKHPLLPGLINACFRCWTSSLRSSLKNQGHQRVEHLGLAEQGFVC
jgi:hypothetical protein